jgi:hypothetical protein
LAVEEAVEVVSVAGVVKGTGRRLVREGVEAGVEQRVESSTRRQLLKNGGEADVPSGRVTGGPEVTRKLRAAKAGDLSAAAEIEAARALRKAGLDVHFRTAAGDIGVQGVRTSDFLINGIPFEVFSPTTANPSRIVSQLAKKLPQADRFVLNLSQSSVGTADLRNLLGRINNIPGIPRSAKEVILVRDGAVVGHLQ